MINQGIYPAFLYIKRNIKNGNSALMLVRTKLRHVASIQWGQQEIHEHKASETALGDTPYCG